MFYLHWNTEILQAKYHHNRLITRAKSFPVRHIAESQYMCDRQTTDPSQTDTVANGQTFKLLA